MMKKNKTIWIVVIYVSITFLITALLAIFQQQINLSFEKISFPQLAPAIGAFITLLICKNSSGYLRIQLNKTILLKSLTALIIPLVLFAFSFLASKPLQLDIQPINNLSTVLPGLISGMLFGAIGEEMGWRSFLQPTLEKTNSMVSSSIVVGVIWGLWHVGHYKNGILFMTGFLIFTISASIIIGRLLKDTKYSLIVSVIFHLSVNFGFLVFFYNSIDNNKFMLTNAVVWLIVALVMEITEKKRTAKKKSYF